MIDKRKKIYDLLIEGIYAKRIAKLLRIPYSTVRGHIAELLRLGAIEVRSNGKPKFYERGPNSYLVSKRETYDTRYEKQAPPCRFHWVSAKCEILQGKCPDLSSMKWDSVWHPREGQTYRLLRLKQPEATVRVYDEKSLEIWIPDTYVDFDPDALRESANILEQRIYEVIKHLSSNLQFGLGIATLTRMPHIAQEIPDLKGKKLQGKIEIDDHTWIDDSLKDSPELEGDDLEDQILRATAHRDLPKLMRLVNESISQSKLTQESNDEMIAVLLESNTDTGKRHNELLKRLDQLLKKLTPTESEYIPPTDSKNEDKQPPGYL